MEDDMRLEVWMMVCDKPAKAMELKFHAEWGYAVLELALFEIL